MSTLIFRNLSSVVSDDELKAFMADFQEQINNEFQQAWSICASVMTEGTGWPITLMDEPGPNDPKGAFGYHFLDETYQPYAIVFAKLAKDSNTTWTSVASHEGLEMLADPLINSTCFIDTSNGAGTAGYLISLEICDAVERLSYPGKINQTELSDFVFPGWFIPGYPDQVDQMKQVPGPLRLASGGYISADQIIQTTGWEQTLGDNEYKKLARHVKQQPMKRQPKQRVPFTDLDGVERKVLQKI